MKEKREKFSNRLGFILSCVGAAVGLGNIWMFSWKLGTFGGGAFLIPYFIFMAFFAYIGLISEISFGRMIKKGVMGVSELMKEKNIPLANYLPLISIVSVSGIFTFYIIVFGWIIKYFFAYVTIDMNAVNYPEYFGAFVGTSSSIGWHILAGLISIGVISLGVVKGIEKLNKFIMPLMFIIFIGLMIKSLTLPGAMEGIKYLLTPKWEALANPQTWIMALGQSFFTVGLSGSALLVYGSYLGDDIDIPNSVFHTCILDTCAALLAGFVIIPAAFAFGHNPGAGPGLLFITVPAIFSQISGGKILAGIFFLSVIFAAVSSAINQLEVPVEAFMFKFNVSRKKASIIIGSILVLIGIPLDLNMDLFGKFADLMSVILIPLGALIILAFFFFAIDNKKIIAEIDKGASKKRGKYIIGFGKYLFVPGTAAVLILGLIFGSIG
ncbi:MULTISPECIES: sodium-dependent transporter [Fusobacterium]|uniref:sodium-dependent transporter n=1 Tax=Fusobacterium TaxID=848 RepID=UPI001F1DC1FC|nr:MULTISPECIES: sodium-dependent transporter [Fusobacterium]MCF2611825.1 sodium-dependent transporter [Fusobacterium perfoetens]MDY2981437.1 sodium-dependent transporter [Fusobacterium sp.]